MEMIPEPEMVCPNNKYLPWLVFGEDHGGGAAVSCLPDRLCIIAVIITSIILTIRGRNHIRGVGSQTHS